MMKLKVLRVGVPLIGVCALALAVVSYKRGTFSSVRSYFSSSAFSQMHRTKPFFLRKDQVAEALGPSLTSYQFPRETELKVQGAPSLKGKVQYSIDPKLQKDMESLFQTYDPDYGAFVAMDPSTGKILSMVSYSRQKNISYNLALRASFPSASVFKVVTAVAAIEGHKISGDSVIPFNGRNHTLYRGQILKSNITRWTRFITVREAFAHSINTVFGKLGAFTVGHEGLREYADRFQFNHKIEADMPVQEGRAWIPEDAWGLAESASGYTKDNTMSPLQGALIAASVANDGVMMEPFIVESIMDSQGMPVYVAEPKVAQITMERKTANEVRELMRETVLHGTSKNSFRGFFRKNFSLVNVGGKTGSLTGYDPRGKYDWFVGYADSGSHRLAVAALTIHEKLWRVKSAYLARKAIESYLQETSRSKTFARQ